MRVKILAVFLLGVATSAGAQSADLKPKFISYDDTAGPTFVERSGLPQIGDEIVADPSGAKRIRARIGDDRLVEYVQAHLIAVEVFRRYDAEIARAPDRDAAKVVAITANAELVEALETAGGMDYGEFTAMSDALKRDDGLRARAQAVADRVLGG